MSRVKVSSSRRSVVELLGSALLAAWLGPVLPGCRRAFVTGPFLRVTEKAEPAPAPTSLPTLWLALAALEPERRAALLDELEAALAAAEARKNPLLVDFLEDDPREVLRRAQPWFLPICTAAHALLSKRCDSADGLSVEVLARNAPREPGDVAAWGSAPGDERARRARFLAWPVSRALVLQTRGSGNIAGLDAELRHASADPACAVGLALSSSILHGRGDDPRLVEVVGRLAAAARRSGKPFDADLWSTLPEAGKELAPWIALSESERLVVPKLGGLSPRGRFESTVGGIAARHGADLSTGTA